MGALYVPFYGVNIHLKIHTLAQADKDPRPAILIYSYPWLTIERVTKNYGKFSLDIYIKIYVPPLRWYNLVWTGWVQENLLSIKPEVRLEDHTGHIRLSNLLLGS